MVEARDIFHMTCCETTVTLQDVDMLWGLPIEGFPVTDSKWKLDKLYWIDTIHRLLCVRLVESD